MVLSRSFEEFLRFQRAAGTRERAVTRNTCRALPSGRCASATMGLIDLHAPAPWGQVGPSWGCVLEPRSCGSNADSRWVWGQKVMRRADSSVVTPNTGSAFTAAVYSSNCHLALSAPTYVCAQQFGFRSSATRVSL